MKVVGIFEGKTHFSALIEQAAGGATIVVTNKGKPVAKIVPFEDKKESDTLSLAIRKAFI